VKRSIKASLVERLSPCSPVSLARQRFLRSLWPLMLKPRRPHRPQAPPGCNAVKHDARVATNDVRRGVLDAMSGVKLDAAEAPRQLAKLLAKSKLRHHCPPRNRPAYSSWPVEALAEPDGGVPIAARLNWPPAGVLRCAARASAAGTGCPAAGSLSVLRANATYST